MKSKKVWVSIIVIALTAGIGGYYWYFSEHPMLKRARSEAQVGNVYVAESILKDCIRRHDSILAKRQLVKHLVNARNYDTMMLLNNTLSSTDGANRYDIAWRSNTLNDEFARGFNALASEKFETKQWAEARQNYYIAYVKYSNGFQYSHSTGMGCLRNAIAASWNNGNKVMVRRLCEEFLTEYAKHQGEYHKDSLIHKNAAEVRSWQSELHKLSPR